ncbi:hypothetical protein ACFYZ2_14200 [Streptomyces sviceus]|uniref:hypothetical protein n=1 Tax=Streptomyces sviceus TaxID=285530 RepID=UPI0036CBE1D6
MRSARILLTTAAASAVLVLGATGAHAAGNDWDSDSSDSSYSKEHTNPKYDPETYKDKDNEQSGGGKHDGGWSGSHEKPSGGMHTGGGGLASPAVTTGGLAMLVVAGTGLYAARRKRVAGSLA